jgi:hypothetical protein
MKLVNRYASPNGHYILNSAFVNKKIGVKIIFLIANLFNEFMRAALGSLMQEVVDYYLKCSIEGRNSKFSITGSTPHPFTRGLNSEFEWG